MTLIGIGGTNGSGKDTVGRILARKNNLLFVSISDFLREEAKKRSLPVQREVLRTISAEWRRDQGVGVLVNKAVGLYKKSADKYNGLVISPMRNLGEARRLHELGGTIVWIDADPKVRYERIRSRLRTLEDEKTFEQFLAEEEAEMHQTGDEATLSLVAVKEIADVFIVNNGDDIDELKKKIEQAMKNYQEQ